MRFLQHADVNSASDRVFAFGPQSRRSLIDECDALRVCHILLGEGPSTEQWNAQCAIVIGTYQANNDGIPADLLMSFERIGRARSTRLGRRLLLFRLTGLALAHIVTLRFSP